MNWWIVSVNGKRYCTEARCPSDAVFSVLRRLECSDNMPINGAGGAGTLWWQEVKKPRNMTKKFFKEQMER